MWRSPAVQRSRQFYREYEPHMAALFFVAGVTWDLAAYDRVDSWTVATLLFAYLLGLGLLMISSALVEAGRTERQFLIRHRRALRYGIQFCLGALLSACVIFYFQSASYTQTAIFLALLIGLLFANEFIHRRLFSVYLLLGLYLVAAYSTFILVVPVLAGSLHWWTYALGSLLTILLTAGVIWLFMRWRVLQGWRQLTSAGAIVLLLFGTLHLFYFMNWMPPVPLSMRHGEVAHHVSREGDRYMMTYEPASWYTFWHRSDRTIHYVPGEPVYVFTAIFAPTAIETDVLHEWQHRELQGESWITTDEIGYSLRGGRRDGYRGYTFKRFMRPGEWRVNVRTAGGRLLGRVRFQAVPVTESVANLQEHVYE